VDSASLTKLASCLGAGITIGFGAIGAAIGEGYTAAQANAAVARNPELSGDVFKTMLVGQAIAESASIFALVVALILLFAKVPSVSYLTACAFLSSGLAMGFGAIGSGIGSGFPAGATCHGIVRQPAMANKLTTNMLIGSAVCQTPAIFSLVIAFIMIFADYSHQAPAPLWAALLGAGLSTGLSAIGAGVGGGLVAQSSSEGIARQPLSAGIVTNSMLLGQAITQTTAIYGLLIGFILLFKSHPASDTLASAMALLGAGICMGIGGIGPGIGEGFTAQGAVKWIARNQEGIGEVTRSMLVGMAVAESTGIYSMVIALVLIFVV
jgi:F-type H+-transporting ATPase subunit c